MDRLAALEAFAKVAETQSFSEAARRLRSSKSAVSRYVAALEADLGARLFHRTTRSLTLTEAGRDYFARTSRILADLDEANASVSQLQTQRDALSSVNLNDEASAMTTLERSYQAAAQVFTMLDTIMASALNLGEQTTVT